MKEELCPTVCEKGWEGLQEETMQIQEHKHSGVGALSFLAHSGFSGMVCKYGISVFVMLFIYNKLDIYP